VTFNGRYAASRGQRVLYVTERAVFEASEQGLRLVEVAPGVDVARDVLGQMEFEPIVDGEPGVVDPRLFREGLLGLPSILGVQPAATG
jgi:propionate CoA-transferase